MFAFNWKTWFVSFYYCFYALPCCCLLPLRAVAHLLMGVMVYYRVQHENKAISSRFADLPATLCVAVYYRWRTAQNSWANNPSDAQPAVFPFAAEGGSLIPRSFLANAARL